jgi:hypothetical protein
MKTWTNWRRWSAAKLFKQQRSDNVPVSVDEFLSVWSRTPPLEWHSFIATQIIQSLSWIYNRVQLCSFWYISHLHLCLQSDVYPSGFPTKMHEFLFPVRCPHPPPPPQPILLHLTTALPHYIKIVFISFRILDVQYSNDFVPPSLDTSWHNSIRFALWRRSSSKQYLRIRSVPQRKHHTSHYKDH